MLDRARVLEIEFPADMPFVSIPGPAIPMVRFGGSQPFDFNALSSRHFSHGSIR
jgi:hypothetical protein